jgi:hypothetical protein
MTTQIALRPAMQLRRGRPVAVRRKAEAAVPDIISLDVAGGPSLEDFVREHGLPLTRFAYLISGDRSRADDLVQDVLLRQRRGIR